MKETTLTNNIVKAIVEKYPDAWVLKTTSTGGQRAGVPDLLLCVEGRFLGLEVKVQRPGESLERTYKRVTSLQRHELSQITRAGGAAAWITSAEDALRIIDDALQANLRS